MAALAGGTIDLGVGQPDFPTPQGLKEAGKRAIDQNYTRYTPQPGFQDLREAVARKFQTENGFSVSADQVVVSCGAKHCLYNVIQCAVGPGDEVIILSPHWSSYAAQVKYAGGTSVFVSTREEDRFQPEVTEVRKALTRRTRMIILNSPCNPTGAVYRRPVLQALADLAVERGLLVISDEVYEKVIFEGAEHISIASMGPEIASRTVTINSISKTHSMTGWRIGYAAMPRSLAEEVTALQSHSTSGPNAIAQRAALAALAGEAPHVAEMAAEYARRRRLLLDRLGDLKGMTCTPPEGTFYAFVNISPLLGTKVGGRTVASGADMASVLLDEAGVKVIAGTEFGSPRHIRLSFAASPEAIREALDRVEFLLAGRPLPDGPPLRSHPYPST